jgi:pimeloyl-ACP methyl ester carboxylesterase
MYSITMGIVFAIVFFLAWWFSLKRLYRETETAREIHTIRTPDGWHITLYRYCGDTPGEPVLLCHGLSGNRFNFAYPLGRSIVDHLVNAGYDCWAVELRGCRSSMPPPGKTLHDVCFEDYVHQDLPTAIAHILRNADGERIHWIGHSMGGMLLYAYELAHGRDALASGITLGTPPGFDGVRHSRHTVALAIMTRFPQSSAVLLRLTTPIIPLLRISNTIAPINWDNMQSGVHFYNLMELPPPRVLAQFSQWTQTNEWRLDDGHLDVLTGLRTLATPLLTIGGAADSLAPPRNLEEFHEHLPGDDKALLILSRANGNSADYNHVDLVFSRRGKKEVFQPILEWLQRHGPYETNATSRRQALEQSQAAIALLDSPAPMKTAPKPKRTPKKSAARKSKAKKNTRSGQALWGNALEDAATVLSGLSEGTQAKAASSKKKTTAKKAKPKPKKKAVKKKAAKKKTTTKKSPSRKTAAKKPAKTKSGLKKKTTTKKPAAKKRKPKGTS